RFSRDWSSDVCSSDLQPIATSTDQSSEIAQALAATGNSELEELAKSLAASRRPLVATLLETDTNPASVPEAYLKLHLLSHRLVKIGRASCRERVSVSV